MFYIMFYPPTSIPFPLPDRTKCTKNNQYPTVSHKYKSTKKELANNQSCWTVLGVMKL